MKTDWKRAWQAISALPTNQFPLSLPGAHRLAAFFILRRLKRLGYSNCRVDSSRDGLMVYAQR